MDLPGVVDGDLVLGVMVVIMRYARLRHPISIFDLDGTGIADESSFTGASC